MPLAVGDFLGPYEILAPIGAGGMGEVYKARDTKLDREVAIKVLPAALARDPERLARFEREAKVVASLNHPNIAQIYGIEESTQGRALVMELVPGETLKVPLPQDEALRIAGQIAEALEAAHEKGIIHRDLKPANIMITPGGVVKVLDFGLAAVTQPSAASGGDPNNSPTLTMGATQAGMILGTASYMSPEQTAGQPVDKRADIWSFGVVLWEMLTGQRLFTGASIAHILADVLRAPIDFDKLPSATPRVIRDLVKRCLDRDVKTRLRDIGEARVAIQKHVTDPSGGIEVSQPGKALPTRLLMAVAAALLVALAIAGWGWWRSTRSVDRPLMRLSVDLGPDAISSAGITVAISPDGTRLVFPVRGKDGKQQLSTRLLDQTAATVLPGTEDASDPFFSPDGQWVGFFADSKLKKISVLGGAPVTLCDAPSGRGASWGPDGNIIATLSVQTAAGLSRIPAAGGTPQTVTALGAGLGGTHRWPQILPGDEAVVFTASPSRTNFEYAAIEVLSLRTGERKTLIRNAYFGRYFPDGRSGYLVYIHDGALFAVPFDLAKLELRGAPAPLLEDLAGDPSSGAGQFDFSQTGTFVYRSGKAPDQVWPVEWLESSGKMSPLLALPAAYATPRFSPDGQRLALAVGMGKGRDIFVYDWRRDAMLRLTFQGNLAAYPVWTPDGKHVAYRVPESSGGSSIEWLRAEGSGPGQSLFESKGNVLPYSFSPDSRYLAYFELTSGGVQPETGANLWTIQLDLTDPDHPKVGKPELFLRGTPNAIHPFFSPDGRWIAYSSYESGNWEIYVRSFSALGGHWQISNGGGMHPMWSRTSHELFYTNLDNRIMVADYATTADSFMAAKPRLWSNTQIRDIGGVTNLDLAPDGKRFAVFPAPEPPAQGGAVHMTFLLNFFDEVRRRVLAAGK